MGQAASITARYSKAKGMEKVEVNYRKIEEDQSQSLFASPVLESDIKRLMVSE